jgi:hypothetical protein
MATTNLISKSLGDILTESGNGSPDHVSPKGSIYTDKNSAKIYQNIDGGTTWLSFSTVAYGYGYYQGNTSQTTISSSNVWVGAGINLTEGDSVGFSANTDTLVVLNGYDGDYEVNGEVTIDFVAGTNNYEVGLSINGNNPSNGTYNGTTIDTTYQTQHIGFDSKVTLSGGTTLEFAVRNLTNTDNLIIKNAQLFVRRLE